jgi:hypothetical protein
MSEWFMELVLKTSDSARGRGFESLSLRHQNTDLRPARKEYFGLEKYPRGRRGSPAKGVAGDEPGESSNLSFSARKPRSIIYCEVFFMLFPCAFLAKPYDDKVKYEKDDPLCDGTNNNIERL